MGRQSEREHTAWSLAASEESVRDPAPEVIHRDSSQKDFQPTKPARLSSDPDSSRASQQGDHQGEDRRAPPRLHTMLEQGPVGSYDEGPGPHPLPPHPYLGCGGLPTLHLQGETHSPHHLQCSKTRAAKL